MGVVIGGIFVEIKKHHHSAMKWRVARAVGPLELPTAALFTRSGCSLWLGGFIDVMLAPLVRRMWSGGGTSKSRKMARKLLIEKGVQNPIQVFCWTSTVTLFCLGPVLVHRSNLVRDEVANLNAVSPYG